MALITCHECKEQISSEADSCPKCGAKSKKSGGIGAGGVILAVVVGVIAFSCAGSGGGGSPPKTKSAAEIQADSELNTAIAAGRVLKKYTKDPSSFKMESFLIFPGGATCYEYRGKNSFGAIVPAQAVFTPPSTILTSDRDGRAFTKSWNATCTRTGGAERAGGLNLLNVF